jgi:hypothetical protein
MTPRGILPVPIDPAHAPVAAHAPHLLIALRLPGPRRRARDLRGNQAVFPDIHCDERSCGPREAVVRRIGVLAILLAFADGPAEAADANDRCAGLLEESDGSDNPPELPAQPLMTDNQCEALENKELRAPLLEIPQEDEDPVQLSLGIKNGSGMLRLKIPFHF